MSSSNSDSSSDDEVHHNDKFEDVFIHHIVEIEEVWKEVNIARAKAAKVYPSKKQPGDLKMKYPIKLSEIQKVANQELQNMRDFDEGADGEVAESINKEAGVLLSFLGSMFIENLVLKTMYHLPQQKMFGYEKQPETTESSQPTSSSAPSESTTLNSNVFNSTTVLKPIELVLTREDIRRTLLREEQFDFLVQSGLAQPEPLGPAEMIEEASVNTIQVDSDRLHLGYWRIVERTFSALEVSPMSQNPAPSAPPKILTHHPTVLCSKAMMSLTPESDPSHARFTLFPENEDLESNSVEFLLTNTSPSQKMINAKLTGRVKLGHINIIALEGNDININLSPPTSSSSKDDEIDSSIPPFNFSWKTQNEDDSQFPIAGRPMSANGYGSVQLFDAPTAYQTFGSKWLKDCSWGVLSLEMSFQLGDTGFNLHNHYLAIPVFVQPPRDDFSVV